MRSASGSLLTSVLALVLGGLIPHDSGFAQTTFTWTGGSGTTSNWLDNANWSATPGYGNLQFSGSARTTSHNDRFGSQFRIQFNSASSFTLNGNAINFFDFSNQKSQIRNDGSGLGTVNFNSSFNDGNNTISEINAINGDITINGTIGFGGTVTTLEFYGSSRTVTLNGVVSGTGKILRIMGNNTIVLAATNTYTGDTLINNGTLRLAANGPVPGANAIRVGDTSGAAAATLLLDNGFSEPARVVVRPGSSGLKTIGNSALGSGTANYSGNLFLDADATASANPVGGLLFSGVILDLKNQTLTVNGTGDTVISGGLVNSTGSGKLTKAGSGKLTLLASNACSGAILVSSGVVNMQEANALGTTAGGTTVNSGAALQLQGGITTAAEPLTLSGDGISTDGALRSISGNNVYAGNIALAASARVASDADTLTLSGTTDFQNPSSGVSRTLTVSGASSTSISGNFINAATGESVLSKTGAGTLTLSGNNAARVLYNHGGGVLSISAAVNIGVPSGVNYPDKFNFTDNATLRVSANSFTLGSNVSGSDNAGFRIAGGKTGTFDVAGGSTLTIDGVIANISGNGNLAKTGAGTLSLAQPNTFSGNTTVSAGTLALAGVGSVATSPFISIDAAATVDSTARTDGTLTLASGQTLKGNGTVVGILAGANGSTIAPGASIGVITNSGALLLEGGGTNMVEVIDVAGGVGAGHDHISVAGDIGVQATSGNKFNLKLVSLNGSGAAGGVTNFNNDTSYTWNVASGNVTNFDAAAFRIDTESFSNDLAGGEFVLEPGSLNLRFTNNHAPVANVASYVRGRGAGIKIPVANLLAANTSDPDGDARALLSIGSSTNGAFVTNTGSYIMIAPANDLPETISYTVRDLRAAYRIGDTVRTATALIDLSVSNAIGVVNITNTGGGSMSVSFYGIPGYDYVIQRSSNLVDWVDVVTNTTPANGLVQLSETPPHNPAFYRTRTE